MLKEERQKPGSRGKDIGKRELSELLLAEDLWIVWEFLVKNERENVGLMERNLGVIYPCKFIVWCLILPFYIYIFFNFFFSSSQLSEFNLLLLG